MTEGRIRIFAADVRGLPEIPDRRLSELFPEWRAETIRRYRMPEDRKRSAWAELMLRLVLERSCGIPREEQRILRRKSGKPFLAAASEANEAFPEISISHSGPWAAVSFGPAVHGIDVEIPRGEEAVEKVAARWFLPAEAEMLRNTPAETRGELFLRFWTVKESFLKMTGEGLRSGPQAADALMLLSGKERISAWCTVLPGGAVLSCCGPGGSLPAAPEFPEEKELLQSYGF